MISPKPYLMHRVGIFLITLLFTCQLKSQCNPPDQLPTADCATAPFVCLVDACYQTLNIPLTCCNNWCGNNTIINNPQYFVFIPTCPDVEIDIHVDNCTNGVGLQCAILDACPWDNSSVVDCNPGTPPGGTMVLTASGLIVGQMYWLLIDGSNGATCNYTITFANCIETPGFGSESLTSGEAIPSSVCQGFNGLTLTAEPQIIGAHGYYWVLGWSGDTITSTPPTTTLDVPANTPPGIYDICVRAFSGCDTSAMEFCFPVEVYEIPPEDKDPAIYCDEEFPFSWGNVTINGAGDYTQSFTDPDGCVFDSLWTVDAYPIPDPGELDVVYCLPTGETTYTYEGVPYDNSGMYDLFYPKADVNGCDSTAKLNLRLIGLDAFIDISCDNGEFVLTVFTQSVEPGNADLTYQWYESGIPVFDNNPLLTLQDGCYTCEVTVAAPEGECVFTLDQFCFSAANYYPPPPVLANNDTLICAQAGVFFHVIEDPFGEQGLQYTWSAPSNVPVFQDGGPTAEMDFSNSSGGQVCVYATGQCGQGSSTCFNVDIIPTPVASFTFTPDVCIDQLNTITFTGSASANATVIWDFNNPTTLTGSGIGPYNISWALEGNKTITLTVIEPGCDTAFNSAIVTVSHLDVPVINCTSTINSILFDWADIAGSTGYLISLNGGAAFPVPMSEYLDQPLLPGTNVTMILTVQSAGPCPNVMDTMTCIAQNCPPPTIVLSGQDSACLNNPLPIDLDAVVNGNPGTGTWSGPGITDPLNGIFDPKIAGAGQQQLIYTVDVNGCPFTQPYTIIVFDSLTADFALDPVICIADVANLLYTGNASGAATYDYTFGPATVVAGAGSGPYQLSWNSTGLKTVRLQVSENGCISDVISHDTDVKPTLNAPLVNCAPNTSGLEFTFATDPTAFNVDTVVLTGQAGTNNGNKFVFTGLTAGDTVRVELLTYSAGPCPDRIDTFFCVARACPMPIITITPVNDICLYPGTGIVNLQVDVQNGNGVGDWSGPGIVDPVNGKFDPNVAGAGAHQITYHYVDDACDFNNAITINVYDPPVAFVSNSDFMITCATNSIFLDGSSSSGGNLIFRWTTADGVIASGANTAIAEATAKGTYQLLVTNSISGCKDSISVLVTVDANIPTADAGPDRKLTCDSTQFTLGGPATTAGVNIVYSWTTAGGNILGPTNGTHIDVNKTGDYSLMVRDTATGCQASDLAVVTIDTVLAAIMLTPGDSIDCNTPISTVTSTLNEPVNDYLLHWGTIDGTISGPVDQSNINVSQGGTYTLTIHNKRNGCETSASAFVPESNQIIQAVDVTTTNIRCFGENNGSLVITGVTGGIPPYTYQWAPGSSSSSSLTSLPPGQYALTVSDHNGCSFTKTYTVTEPALVTIDLGPNLTVAAQDSVTIDLTTNVPVQAISSVEWSPYNGETCEGCLSFDFIATTSATISSMITDTAGCSAEDSMRLTVIVPRIIFIPNVFSPNGDGINDYFTISGRFNLINIAELNIYDRWGNQLFGKVNLHPGVLAEGWDGKFREKDMQPGVYVYVAKLDYEDGVSETVSGSITLVR
jgi:gliding motility-associated-like protein